MIFLSLTLPYNLKKEHSKMKITCKMQTYFIPSVRVIILTHQLNIRAPLLDVNWLYCCPYEQGTPHRNTSMHKLLPSLILSTPSPPYPSFSQPLSLTHSLPYLLLYSFSFSFPFPNFYIADN